MANIGFLKGRDSGGSNRVMRGGSWNNDAGNLRCANRNNDRPSNRNNNLGFRLCQHNFFPEVKRPRLFYRCIKLSIKNVSFLLLLKQDEEY